MILCASKVFTYTHPLATTSEKIVFQIPFSIAKGLKGIWIDCANLTKDCMFRLRYKIDDDYQRVFETVDWNTSSEPGVLMQRFPLSHDLMLTIESLSSEVANRSVPYKYFYEINEPVTSEGEFDTKFVRSGSELQFTEEH